MTKIFIIIPTFNEKENLPILVKRIFELKIPNLNLLIIDDNSPDGTGEIAEQLKKKYQIQVIHRSQKQGLGSAYRLGFERALSQKADLIFQMDADLSHNPYDIPKFIAAADQAEVVLGSRRIKGGKIIGWNWWRKFSSWSATKISKLLLSLPIQDTTSGFRCYQAQFLKKIPFGKIKSQGYAWQEEILLLAANHGAKIKEIPITFVDRQKGQSKLNLKEIIEFFITLIRLGCQKRQNY